MGRPGAGDLSDRMGLRTTQRQRKHEGRRERTLGRERRSSPRATIQARDGQLVEAADTQLVGTEAMSWERRRSRVQKATEDGPTIARLMTSFDAAVDKSSEPGRHSET